MDFYLITKAIHIIAVISWMAGLLYLPRLFVYHIQLAGNSEASETFKVMERRLMKAIMTPAMTVAILSGLVLLFYFGNVDWHSFWLSLKLFCLVAMIAIHLYLAKCLKDFTLDRNRNSERFYRILNEAPAVLMIIIVVMVIVRPF